MTPTEEQPRPATRRRPIAWRLAVAFALLLVINRLQASSRVGARELQEPVFDALAPQEGR